MLKRGIACLIIFLIVSMPICFAEEINIPETFKAERTEEITSYFYTGSSLMATKDSNGIKYYSQDRLGTNRLTTDINANQIGETKTLPFGEEIVNDNKFSFTGKELDSELYYFGARYYDFDTGRFTSVDPIGTDYQYTENDPMNLIDPLGLAPGDPLPDSPGYVENLNGAPISEERYNQWRKQKTRVDEIVRNPSLFDKFSAWYQDTTVEESYKSVLMQNFPDMYYSIGSTTYSTLADSWSSMSPVEKAALIANAGIFAITAFAPVGAGAKTRATPYPYKYSLKLRPDFNPKVSHGVSVSGELSVQGRTFELSAPNSRLANKVAYELAGFMTDVAPNNVGRFEVKTIIVTFFAEQSMYFYSDRTVILHHSGIGRATAHEFGHSLPGERFSLQGGGLHKGRYEYPASRIQALQDRHMGRLPSDSAKAAAGGIESFRQYYPTSGWALVEKLKW